MNCQGDPQGITANAISKGDGDVYHAAGLYMAREVWEQGIVVKEEGGDGEPYIMKSLAGGVDGKPGYFEAGMKPGVDNIDHALFRESRYNNRENVGGVADVGGLFDDLDFDLKGGGNERSLSVGLMFPKRHNIELMQQAPARTRQQVFDVILYEVTQAFYHYEVNNLRFSLDKRDDNTMFADCLLKGTFVEKILFETDYFMKAYWHGAAFLESKDMDLFHNNHEPSAWITRARHLMHDRIYKDGCREFCSQKKEDIGKPGKLHMEIRPFLSRVRDGGAALQYKDTIVMAPDYKLCQWGSDDKGEKLDKDSTQWKSLKILERDIIRDQEKQFWFDCLGMLSTIIVLTRSLKKKSLIPKLKRNAYRQFHFRPVPEQIPPLLINSWQDQGDAITLERSYPYGGVNYTELTSTSGDSMCTVKVEEQNQVPKDAIMFQLVVESMFRLKSIRTEATTANHASCTGGCADYRRRKVTWSSEAAVPTKDQLEMVLNAFGKVQQFDLKEGSATALFYGEADAKNLDENYRGPWHVNKF